ncbi:MAG: hypothetical protein AB7U85_07450 [Alphaproteobacteria bacterium]
MKKIFLFNFSCFLLFSFIINAGAEEALVNKKIAEDNEAIMKKEQSVLANNFNDTIVDNPKPIPPVQKGEPVHFELVTNHKPELCEKFKEILELPENHNFIPTIYNQISINKLYIPDEYKDFSQPEWQEITRAKAEQLMPSLEQMYPDTDFNKKPYLKNAYISEFQKIKKFYIADFILKKPYDSKEKVAFKIIMAVFGRLYPTNKEKTVCIRSLSRSFEKNFYFYFKDSLFRIIGDHSNISISDEINAFDGGNWGCVINSNYGSIKYPEPFCVFKNNGK